MFALLHALCSLTAVKVIVSVVVLAATLLLIYVGQFYEPRTPMVKDVPVIKSNSIVGFTHFVKEKFMQNTMKALGPLAQYTAFFRNILVINDPTLAKNVLRDVKGKGLFHNFNHHVNPYNMFSYDTGPEWAKRRSMFRKSFSLRCLRAHVGAISKMSSKLEAYLDQRTSIGTEGAGVHRVDDLFVELTIGVICEIAFGLDMHPFEVGAEANTDETNGNVYTCERVNEAIKVLFKYGWILRLPGFMLLLSLPFHPFSTFNWGRNFYRKFRAYILRHLRRRHEQKLIEPGSLAMSILEFAALPGVTDIDVMSEISVFFVAGMDTTAHTLAFTIYALAKHPDIQQKAQEVVDAQASQAGKGQGAAAAQAELPKYLEAVLKESMRKYPTAATGSFRLVTAPEGYSLTPDIFLPKGWWVSVNIFCLQNSQAAWGPDADKFIPERWLNPADVQFAAASGSHAGEDSYVDPLDEVIDPLDQSAIPLSSRASNSNPLASPAAYGGTGPNPSELTFCPFSFGPRNCLGMNLALIELRMALSMLISKYHFELASDEQVDQDNVLETSFTMRPKDGMPVRISKRG